MELVFWLVFAIIVLMDLHNINSIWNRCGWFHAITLTFVILGCPVVSVLQFIIGCIIAKRKAVQNGR